MPCRTMVSKAAPWNPPDTHGPDAQDDALTGHQPRHGVNRTDGPGLVRLAVVPAKSSTPRACCCGPVDEESS